MVLDYSHLSGACPDNLCRSFHPPGVEEEEESVGTVKRCDFVAVWILGETPEDPGQMEIGNVRAIYGRAAKKGFLQKDATDPASANGDELKLELFDYDEESGELKPRAGGCASSASPPRKRMPCWLPLGRARPACYAFLTMSGGR